MYLYSFLFMGYESLVRSANKDTLSLSAHNYSCPQCILDLLLTALANRVFALLCSRRSYFVSALK